MTRRIRTAKTLGTRHDLNYFRAWGTSRRAALLLTVGIPAALLLWLSSYALHGSSAPYSKGPLSSAHAVFGEHCQTCHSEIHHGIRSSGFKRHTSDEACLTCHAAPVHQAKQTFTPSCGSCHVEHAGATIQLKRVADRNCTQCHANLKTNAGNTKFIGHIVDFNQTHPEFAPLRAGYKNSTTITFSHALHLKEQLAGPAGSKVQLICQDCHRVPAQANSAWKYGIPELQHPSRPATIVMNGHDALQSAYMMPVSYNRACIACHELQFDPRFNGAAPHDKPEIVDQFVTQHFRDYIAHNPSALHEAAPATLQVAEMQPLTQPRNADEWIKVRVREAEQLLWRQDCKLCHQVDFAIEGLPSLRPSNMQDRWLPNSVFSHEAHQGLTCESCHTAVPTSNSTADKLMPSIKTCTACHKGEPTRMGVADNSCALCHTYHNWNEPQEWKTPYNIRDVAELHAKWPY